MREIMCEDEFYSKTCKIYDLLNSMMTELKAVDNLAGVDVLDRLRVALIANENVMYNSN